MTARRRASIDDAPDPMHVLYVLGQSTGGLPHYTAALANAVAERIDVTVLKPSETTADDLFSDEVDVRDAFEPLELSLTKLYALDVNVRDVIRGMASYNNIEQIKEIDADVVHETADLFPQVKFFAKLHGIDKLQPFVVTRHEVLPSRFPLSQPPVLAEELIDLLVPDLETARTIVHTEAQREALVDRGIDPRTIEVIPHGAYSLFGDHDDVESDPEPNTLLFFGNLIPQKGLDTLVEAIPLLKREIPDVKLVIAGEGQISDSANDVIDAHEDSFEIHNYFVPNDQVKELFARAEVVVMPYREQGGTKGHSGVLATAFSFGKPVVTSTAGDFPEQVEASGAGRVVPPEDPERLASAIGEVLEDEDAKERMAANSREMADRLSWDAVADRHVDLYRTILERRLPASSGE